MIKRYVDPTVPVTCTFTDTKGGIRYEGSVLIDDREDIDACEDRWYWDRSH